MKKSILRQLAVSLLLAACYLMPLNMAAQEPVRNKIAIFAPLYLDSAFDAGNEYRYANNAFPKFLNQGIEFYEGAQLALDSLSRAGRELEIYLYDTRSSSESLAQQLERPELNEVGLIIANCTSNEVWTFASAGLKKKIPVINVTIPTDGGASANPFFVVLNPTLKTHCEAIYRHVQKFYSINPVVVFRKKGSTEDMVKNYLDDFGKATAGVPLKIKYVDLIDSFTVNQLKQHLDDSRNTLCIAGSLDVNFGRRLITQLSSLYKEYPTTIMGMPTWEGIRDFNRPELKGPEILYGNAFYNAKTDRLSTVINNHFTNVMYARPSDMVFRGYEVIWKFANLLLDYGKDLSSNLASKQYKVFTDFDIQPILSRTDMTLQHFENKKVYFIKWQDGTVKGVN
jgi:hypothetical protein